MGTDIHGVFQRNNNGKWEDIPSDYQQDRHYLLFAWIGNVRNGFGFAGIQTHTEIPYLTSCRGFPDDFVVDGDSHPIASFDVMDSRRREYRDIDDSLEIWMGDHSYSWVSADEVISAVPPRVLRTGIVTKKQFTEWDGVTGPESWSGGISGANIVVSDPSDVTDKTSHVRIEWFEDTKETFAYFIDEMKRLKELHGDVRFVFGFDS